MKKILLVVLLPLLLPQAAFATTIYLTTGSQWTVPSDWNNSNNTVEVIGGGGGGSSSRFGNGAGGGGGGYSKATNISLTRGQTVTYAVGSGGGWGFYSVPETMDAASGGTGGDSYFCNSASNCSSMSGSSVVVAAKGGTGGRADGTAGIGGNATNGVGGTKYSGGSGGGNASGYWYDGGGAGGGGGAGRSGNGIAGGAWTSGSGDTGAVGATGGAGDGGYGGAGGPGGPASFNALDGGTGGSGAEWDSVHGSGGGGGGGGYHGDIYCDGGGTGGSGGSYGAGGGSAGYNNCNSGWDYGGSGAQGLIVITYTPAPASCTVSFDRNPLPYGFGTTMHWSSTNADQWLYINNVGYVGASGSASVAPRSATDYSCIAYGTGGTDGWHSAVLSVSPPPAPVLTVSADSAAIRVGQSTVIRATFAPGSGDSLTNTALNEVPPGAGEFTIPGYGYAPVSRYDYTFAPASAGTYVFKPYVITSYYNGWNTWGISTSVTVTLQSCTSAPNACGQTGNGTINVNNQCTATTPPNPAGYGNACASSQNACGQTNTGTIQCNGTCSATTPPNPAGYGSACTSAANACGQTNSGTRQCNGTCSATTPPNPAGYGNACTSAANACGQTNAGTLQCNGTCSATPPPNPAGYGSACTSAANACGQTNTGTRQCNGTCSATTPPNSSCGNPTCSVTFDANPAPYGTGTTMRWTSARAASFTIQNVGPVTPNVAGSAHVAPSSATSYNGSVVGHNGSTVSCPATLNVSAPSGPTATISSSLGATVKIGQSSTITATFGAGSGDTLLADNIDSPLGTGLAANANPTSPKSITFAPSSAGAFTFYARARTSYYSSWTTYAQTSVTVPPLPACSVTFDANPVTRGQSTVVRWSSSNATSFTLQTIGPVTPNQTGSVTVAPQSTANYSGSATGAGGSASCPATLTVQCTPGTAYSCSGQTIVRTDTAASCNTTVSNTTTCVSPAFCSAGSAACLYPPVEFAPDGHLTVRPAIVLNSHTSRVRWNVSNVSSCTVAGTNGDSWTIAGNAANGWRSTSDAPGKLTAPITEQTTYTLTCTSLDGTQIPQESATVNIIPIFKEV